MPFYELDGIVPVVDPTAFIHAQASIIGDVIIGPNCYVGPFVSLRADFGRIVIGAGSNLQDSVTVHAFPGADATLAPRSHVGHGVILHGCTIGSNALIGMNATVLDGAEIGEDALVGAGAVVTAGTIVPPATLVLGSPARVVKELDEETIAWKRRGVDIYLGLTRRSLASLRPVEPLTAVEPDRKRMPTGPEVSQPLHRSRS